MRLRICLGAAVAAAAFGGLLDSPPDGIPRIHSAEAKDYYTRKRVNGRWITGHFPKRDFVARRAPKRLAVVRFASRAVPAPSAPSRPAPAARTVRPTAAAEPTITAETTITAEPTAAPLPATEPLAPPPSDERMLRLRAALQAHAKTLATGSVRPAAAAERASVPDAPQPAAIAYDLQTGLKRTTFTDGSVLEEEFDVEAVKGRAGATVNGPRGPGAGGAP